MDLVFTSHSEEAIRDRAIDRRWVLATVSAPERIEQDPVPGRMRAFRRIPDRDNRWLRVVYEDKGEERRIVTLFFDRKAGKSI